MRAGTPRRTPRRARARSPSRALTESLTESLTALAITESDAALLASVASRYGINVEDSRSRSPRRAMPRRVSPAASPARVQASPLPNAERLSSPPRGPSAAPPRPSPRRQLPPPPWRPACSLSADPAARPEPPHTGQPGASAGECIAEGTGLREARAGERASFSIQAHDRQGQPKRAGGDVFEGFIRLLRAASHARGRGTPAEAVVAFANMGGGRYTGSYVVTAAGYALPPTPSLPSVPYSLPPTPCARSTHCPHSAPQGSLPPRARNALPLYCTPPILYAQVLLDGAARGAGRCARDGVALFRRGLTGGAGAAHVLAGERRGGRFGLQIGPRRRRMRRRQEQRRGRHRR